MKLYAVLCAIPLAGCATFHIEPANQPLPTPVGNLIENDRGLSGDDGQLFVGLAFSGGGMRAAAFSYGGIAADAATALARGYDAKSLQMGTIYAAFIRVRNTHWIKDA